jgi:hypothetical protein
VGEPLRPGVGHTLQIPLSTGDYSRTVTVSLGMISHRPGWQMSLSPAQVTLQPGQVVEANLTVTPSLGARLGTGDVLADVEAYVDGVLLGGVRKLDIPPAPLHNPFEKGYAESEIAVSPYPPQLGKTSWVSTTLQNSSIAPVTVDLTFGWAQFGMGIPFSVTGMNPMTRSLSIAPGQSRVVGVQWTPVHSGHQCVRVLLRDHDHFYESQESQRNVDVVERTFCGEYIRTFSLENPLPVPVTVTLGMSSFNLSPGWGVKVYPSGPLTLQPLQTVQITVKILIPCPVTVQDATLQRMIQQMQDLSGSPPTVNVEAVANGELIGGIQLQFSSTVELPKLYLPLMQR